MLHKLKVIAMLLCVALAGTLSSCEKDDGGNNVPTDDNEIYNLLIGKWRVQMVEVQEPPYYTTDLSWTGTLWFKESGELEANGLWCWRIPNDEAVGGYDEYLSSWSGIGSFALYKCHLDLVVPNYVTDMDGGYSGRWGSMFDLSGTIHSITGSNMVIWATGPCLSYSDIHSIAYKIQCTKIEE